MPLGLFLGLGLAGCSGAEQAAKTVTVERQTTTVIKQAPAPADSPAQDAPTTSSSEDDGEDSASSGAGCGSKVRVPDMVGKDHQLAQDTMQAAGLYNLQEEDATGQGRLLIIDRNWTVVRQKPAGGSCVSEDATITLFSKKDDE